jgi:HlyD family secretion protein
LSCDVRRLPDFHDGVVFAAVIDQVEKGQRAYIRLDSRPDLVLTGEVESVGVLPSKQDRWLSPDVKVFEVFIKLDNKPEGLKPNLTAQVEIVLAELKDVLHVPVAAVFTEQELTYCWRLASEKPARAPIKVGRMNDAQVEVVSGLNEGDRVLLKPPEGAASGKGLKSGSSSTRPTGTTMPNGKDLRTPGREEGTGRPGGERPGRPRKEGGSQPTTKEAFRVPSAMPASTSRTSDPGRS